MPYNSNDGDFEREPAPGADAETGPAVNGAGSFFTSSEHEVPPPDEDEGRRIQGGRDGAGPGNLSRLLKELLTIVIIAFLIAIVAQSFVVKAFVIPSSSMLPTLEIGDKVLVDRISYSFRDPRRGEIIVFRYPPGANGALNTTNPLYWPFERVGETLRLANRMEGPPFVKRVIAIGGDSVEIIEGKVFVNDKVITEEYAVADDYNMTKRTIPNGELFCMGDNRANSMDSRYWGTIPRRAIIGKACLIWWPLGHFGTL